MEPEALKAAMESVGEKYDADILAYIGFIFEPDDDAVLRACRRRTRKRKNVLLILSTPGGSADAAYRIGRCLQGSYKTKAEDIGERGVFYLYVHDMCKSAGTLVALGASTLIMSQRAELGPVDVQLLNEEEVGERRSGLAPRQAMEILSTEAGRTFLRMFRLARGQGLQLPTKLAADTAATMAIGLMEPIYAQLDPLRIGEIERSVNIAQEYGERLRSSNVKKDTIERLLSKYPSHEFVIDRDEAVEMFERVETPSDELETVGGAFIAAHHPTPENMNSFVQFINAPMRASVEGKDAKGSRPVKAAPSKPGSKRPTLARTPKRIATRPGANGSGNVG